MKRKSNPHKIEKYMREKLAFVFLIITLALFALGVAVSIISFRNKETYARVVMSQQDYDSRSIDAQRGNITDRNGTVLATNEVYYNMIIDPDVILSDSHYLETTVNTISANMEAVDAADLRARINDNPDSHYIRYITQMTTEEKDAIQAVIDDVNAGARGQNSLNQVRGVWFETNHKRVYPYGSLACNVLGFSSADGSTGTFGIEEYYNDVLVGTDGREYGYLSDVSNVERVTVPATDGYTIVSTIDTVVQEAIERQIANYSVNPGADVIAVIAMDPNNGEILGMATNRTYDLNDRMAFLQNIPADQIPADVTDPETGNNPYQNFLYDYWNNYCISDAHAFEPGSTAKVFTVAMAIEEGLIDPETYTVNCDGGENFPGNIRVRCHLHSGHGTINVRQALAYSCNDAMMHLSRLGGAQLFTNYLQLFGLGMKTGVDLPGEGRGVVWDAEDITDLTLCTNSFGQNYNVTVLQMAAAYCSIINGGDYYTPHVVRQIQNSDGNIIRRIEPEVVRQTISESTARVIREGLLQAVQYGTGKSGKIAGYNVAGKSGTAQKGDRSENNYIISFAGFVPYDDPQILIYAIMDQPHVADQSSGGYATMLVRDIMQELLPHLGIYPDDQAAADAAAAEAAAPVQSAPEEAYPEGVVEGGNGGQNSPEAPPAPEGVQPDDPVPVE